MSRQVRDSISILIPGAARTSFFMSTDLQISYRDLPVLSAVTAKALELIQRSDVTNQAIGDLIRQDPGLTQRLLQTANAPFYSGRRGPQTINEAIVRLGLRPLRNILLAAAAGEICNLADPWAQSLWD